MASTNDRVRVTRPDGSELTISRASYEGVYQHLDGWKLVEDEKKPAPKKATSSKKGADDGDA